MLGTEGSSQKGCGKQMYQKQLSLQFSYGFLIYLNFKEQTTKINLSLCLRTNFCQSLVYFPLSYFSFRRRIQSRTFVCLPYLHVYVEIYTPHMTFTLSLFLEVLSLFNIDIPCLYFLNAYHTQHTPLNKVSPDKK